MWIVLEFRLGDEDGWRVCKWQNGGKYNKVEEVDRKLKDLEGRLNNELDWNVDASKVAFASDKEELDREQWKKNSVIYKLIRRKQRIEDVVIVYTFTSFVKVRLRSRF